ncbi:GntR family transcriptional regulator [Kitasatospora cineracea]|uniref:GntR family transcriptional regulator n=1 Tax=Kitasatospora cineracea TaxID=88074 RepID=UPI0013C2F4E4|nr:GntR family transcriptional regulator [Kitasatospora cineracea]
MPSSLPTYLALSDLIAGEFADCSPGTTLPGEHDLARRFGVNRLTARAAVDELERRWLIRRVRGSGAYTVRRIEYRIGAAYPVSFTEAMARLGVETTTTAEPPERRAAGTADSHVLGVPLGAPVLVLRRTRHVQGVPAVVGQSLLAGDLLPGLEDALAAGTSLHAVMKDTYGIEPALGWSQVRMMPPPPEEARRLALRGRPPLVRMGARIVDRNSGRYVEVVDQWLRPDYFDVIVEVQ